MIYNSFPGGLLYSATCEKGKQFFLILGNTKEVHPAAREFGLTGHLSPNTISSFLPGGLLEAARNIPVPDNIYSVCGLELLLTIRNEHCLCIVCKGKKHLLWSSSGQLLLHQGLCSHSWWVALVEQAVPGN